MVAAVHLVGFDDVPQLALGHRLHQFLQGGGIDAVGLGQLAAWLRTGLPYAMDLVRSK